MCVGYCIFVFFFFFKQKTAYEMRISDWSSDVCSSDLDQQHGVAEHVAVEHALLREALGAGGNDVLLAQLVEEGVLGQHGQGGKAADHHGDDRQGQVPEIGRAHV